MRCGKNATTRQKVLDALLILLLAGGLGTLLVLNGQAWYARYLAENSITELSAKSDELGEAGRLEVKHQAIAYNKRLCSGGDMQGLLPYDEQLLFDREPMMSYIEIPKIGVKLPIYHGTSDAALMAGIGHLERSSLPVGGGGTHCVLTGHTGMRSAHMFDDLDDLEQGDVFVIWTLSEPHAYMVTQTEVVLPEDTSSLDIDAECDLCTLVTCTPYGVNSHRLLVHATRCAYDPEDEDVPTVHLSDREQSLAWALGLVGIATVGAIARRIAIRRRRAAEWRSKCF